MALAPDERSRPAGRTVALAILGLTAARAIAAALLPITPEEAYHWNFARHLDWSYHDHPPMIAWSIALGRLLFGDTPFGVRFVPLLWSAGTLALLAGLARRAALACIGLVAISPVLLGVSCAGYPDSPLLFFWALALYAVRRAVETERGPWWLLAGAALGGAMLSKYTAAFLVPSILGYLLFHRRRWLATPWPYVAGALALLFFTPVLAWNAAHDWASFRFQSADRFEVSYRLGVGAALLRFLGGQWAAILPLTLPLAVVSLRRDAFLTWGFAPMFLFFLVLSPFRPVHVLWPLPAYLALTVAMGHAEGRVASWYRRRRGALAIATSVLAAGAVFHAVRGLPGVAPFPGLHGWSEVARVAREHAEPGAFYVAIGRKYTCSSQLAFHLNEPFRVHDREILGDPALQYTWWTDRAELRGRDAIVVLQEGDRSRDIVERLRTLFDSVEEVASLEFRRPWSVMRFTFYRARGYH